MTTDWQCPSCGGKKLTKPGKVQASGYRLHREFQLDDGSWLGGSVTVYLNAVICSSCGYVMLFGEPEDLRKLRDHWQQLKD